MEQERIVFTIAVCIERTVYLALATHLSLFSLAIFLSLTNLSLPLGFM